MAYLNLIISTIITVVLTIGIKKILEKKRPLLVSYLTTAKCKFPDQTRQFIDINTHSIIIRNPNKHTINNVVVSHEIFPQTLNALATHNVLRVSDITVVFPYSKEYETQIVETAKPVHAELFKFPKMLKNESIVITYLYPITLTWFDFNTDSHRIVKRHNPS